MNTGQYGELTLIDPTGATMTAVESYINYTPDKAFNYTRTDASSGQYGSGAWAPTNSRETQWLQIMYPSAKRVKGWMIFTGGGYSEQQTGVSVKVQYSDDGSTWTDTGWVKQRPYYMSAQNFYCDYGSHQYWRYVSYGTSHADMVIKWFLFE